MRHFLLIISCVFIAAMALFYDPHNVIASGNTSSDNNPGQIKTQSKDGTLYLTTNVNAGSTAYNPQAATASSGMRRNAISSFIGENIYKPHGFADNIGSYINAILGLVIIVSLLLAFLNFIMAGIQWITSGGDKGKTEEARNKIVHSVIGIIIVSASFALVGFVAYVLGFESINDALSQVRRINPS